MPVQKKISELTAKTGAVEATDLIVISDYNGATYDSKKVSISQVIPYKVFIGVHNQTGSGAPTITGGYSQLTGTLTFALTSAGTYTITNSVAEFLANKTFLFNQWGTGALGNTFQYVVTSTTVITYYTWSNLGILSDGLLAGASLEIKIIN